jgi:catechol 2,3-dioxygenase-like lactoylglutathione lyase family enzyme
MPTPAVGSILLASTDPDRLRAWYERALGVTADADGFLRLGGVGLLMDGRDDVAAAAAEPARVILNLHVDDARGIARHLDAMGVTWLAALEYRETAGAWFGTVLDPDGNYVQVIELTDAHRAARQQRARQAGRGPLADAAVSARLPAQDLGRARRFYAEKLGLCAAAAWCSSRSTPLGCAPSTGSRRSPATTHPPGAAASGPPGSATARATCTVSARRSRNR